MDQRVEVYGTSRHDMNGKRGVATDFHPVKDAGGGVTLSQCRYTVRLDSGELVKVRTVHVQAERVEAAGSGGSHKAKGKGKKGRRKGGT